MRAQAAVEQAELANCLRASDSERCGCGADAESPMLHNEES
ncbi:hypothetical protein [Ancrocorticia populi]|nr:hypothetical protein [Ancrocorticia populi]